MRSLTELTQKDIRSAWTNKCERSYMDLREAILVTLRAQHRCFAFRNGGSITSKTRVRAKSKIGKGNRILLLYIQQEGDELLHNREGGVGCADGVQILQDVPRDKPF